jgi:hemolysin activation/secretion protein
MFPASLCPAHRSRSVSRARAALCVISALCFVPARAQVPPPATPPGVDAAAQAAERQQREEQDRQREDFRRQLESARPPTTIETPALTAPRVNPAVAVRREIRTVQIDGASHLPKAVHDRLVAKYSGQALGIQEVEHLLTEVTQAYLAAGYVTTRAYIPDQDLSTGVLRVLVVEGRIAKIEGTGLRGNIFPAGAGSLLNLRALEQGIDNLNRMPSHQATLDLAPGAQPGDTVVVVRDQRTRPWHASFSADNTGSRDTGREQISATVSADDLLGFGETASVTHRRAFPYHAGRKASESTSGSLNVPWGFESFTLGASSSSYAMTFPAPSGLELPFDGTSKSLFLRTDRVLYRGQTSRLNANATLTYKQSRNFLAHTPITSSSRDASLLDLGLSYSKPWAGGFATLDAGLSRGLAVFGAASDPKGLPDFAPHAEFTAVKLGGSWSRSFKVRGLQLNYSSSLTSQWTNRVLYGADQLTVGGLYAVRGFDRTNLAGDKGYVWRNDVSTTFKIPLGGPARVVSIRPYVGLDHGHAWSNVSGIPNYSGPHGSLVGSVGGVAVSYRRYNADLSWAQSISRAGSMPRESGRFYFRLNASF